MAPKKKQSKNPYFYFMLDFKKREEARGVQFPNGMSDISASEECSNEWRNMTPQQKLHYESRAKDAKVRNGLSDIKYTSQGVPITLIEKEAKRKQDYEDSMNDYIKVAVNMSEHPETLMNKRFYFIHVNWLCRKVLPNGEGDFHPVEFAVAEFSLKNGIQNSYHEIIDMDVPMGYAFEAASHSDDTHKIGRNQPGGQRNFDAMYQNLRNLLKPETIGEELPPLYTTRGVMEIVPGLLSRMAKAAGRSVDIFRVYAIETLFFHLRNASIAKIDGEASSVGFPTLPLAVAEIQKDRFDRAPGIACDYHTALDEAALHCSRSIVIRWAYIICDFCCVDLQIEMKPGSHCPFNVDIDSIQQSKESVIRDVLNYTKAENVRGLASMSGVTEEYRIRTSERTYKEEQERRQRSQPLQIIDHSKLQGLNIQKDKSTPQPNTSSDVSYAGSARTKVERDLRKPNTQSYAMMGAGSAKVPTIDDRNFPAIGGRGFSMKKNLDEHFPPIGRGSGSSFRN